MNARRVLHSLFLPAVLAAPGPGQGNFVNFEIPVVRGVAVATPTFGTYVAVCNADDNSLSILDAGTNTILTRIAVGLGPVSVIYDSDAAGQRFYVANFLGDSVSIVDIEPGPLFQLRMTHNLQTFSGTTVKDADAPTDLAVRPGTNELYVLLSSTGRIACYDKANLSPLGLAAVPTESSQPLRDSLGASPKVMRHPYRLSIPDAGQAFVLNQEGGSNAPGATGVNFDLLRWDFATGLTTVSTLGTTNMAMARAADGRILVASNDAQNQIVGETALALHSLGFVESRLDVIATSPSLALADARNLNRDSTGTAWPSASPASVSMPSDIALLESGGMLQKVFVTSFQTDRIVELTVSGQAPAWPVATTQVPAQGGYALSGPRSMALATVLGQPRLYVLCRLDATLRVYDASATATLAPVGAPIQLPDPMPTAWRAGQKLLYDAKLSGTHKVACGSCHVDGRSDRKTWRLDDPGGASPGTILPELLDGVAGITPNMSNVYPADRGPMVTQTLQGLRANPAETYGADVHPLMSSQPFYWRGVRTTFLSFKPAFQALLGGSQPTDTDMAAFRDFVFTIVQTPNPEQDPSRTFVGSLGNVNSVFDGQSGGALRGLKLFHILPFHDPNRTPLPSPNFTSTGGLVAAGRSCVHCHTLPNGSQSRIAMNFTGQPIRTPQLFGVRDRESEFRLPGDFSQPPAPPYADHGLFHDGSVASINSLLHNVFAPGLGANPPGQPAPSVVPFFTDLVRFTREFDFGVAPLVGRAFTVTQANQAFPWNTLVQFAVTQADLGNVGVVAERRVAGAATIRRFYNVLRQTWSDPRNPDTVANDWTLTALLAGPVGPADAIVFEAVPVGSERRIADPAGTLQVQLRTAPTITGVTLVPADPWKQVTQLSANQPGAGFAPQPGAPPPTSLQALQSFQGALAGSFGVPVAPRHEPPRRFAVTGTNIHHGSRLTLFLPATWSGAQATSWKPITWELNPVRVGSEVRWETSATIAPLAQYALMSGWVGRPEVMSTWNTGVPGAPGLMPATFNQHAFVVSNESTGTPPWHRWDGPITIQ